MIDYIMSVFRSTYALEGGAILCVVTALGWIMLVGMTYDWVVPRVDRLLGHKPHDFVGPRQPDT